MKGGTTRVKDVETPKKEEEIQEIGGTTTHQREVGTQRNIIEGLEKLDAHIAGRAPKKEESTEMTIRIELATIVMTVDTQLTIIQRTVEMIVTGAKMIL